MCSQFDLFVILYKCISATLNVSKEELCDVIDVKNPEGTSASERRRARLEAEASAFSSDHYL